MRLGVPAFGGGPRRLKRADADVLLLKVLCPYTTGGPTAMEFSPPAAPLDSRGSPDRPIPPTECTGTTGDGADSVGFRSLAEQLRCGRLTS